MSHRWLRLVVVLLLCALALGCAGDQGGQDSPEPQPNEAPGAPGGSPGQESGGAPGAPGGGESEAQAVGAPIKIPSFQQKNAAIADVLGSIEDQFKDECGGDELCVELVVRPSDADPAACLFKGTDPPEGTTVERDETVALVCTPIAQPQETPPEETPPPEATQPPPSSS